MHIQQCSKIALYQAAGDRLCTNVIAKRLEVGDSQAAHPIVFLREVGRRCRAFRARGQSRIGPRTSGPTDAGHDTAPTRTTCAIRTAMTKPRITSGAGDGGKPAAARPRRHRQFRRDTAGSEPLIPL